MEHFPAHWGSNHGQHKKNRNKIYFKFQNSDRLGKYEKNLMTSRVTIKSLQKCLRFIMLMIIHTNQS